MRFHAALSDHESTPHAADAVVASAGDAGFASCDVAFCFFTADHAEEAEALLYAVQSGLSPRTIVGCSAEGVIGPDQEIERSPGVALLAASLPGVEVHPFYVEKAAWRELIEDPEALKAHAGAGERTRALLALGDPFTTPTIQLLPVLDQVAPGLPVVGGMASAARQPGENRLLFNDSIYNEGMVGVSLSGDALEVQTVVSQGCRPFGKTFVITRSKDNVVHTLGGRPALQALRDAIMDMPVGDRELLQNGLFLGRATSEYKETFGRGDFLVRNVMGVDNDAGTIAVNDYVRTGQTVQFHVRDAATATEDLNLLLAPERLGSAARPAGGLLFSCNGRGRRLFPSAGHDVGAANRAMPGTPIAGFFAAGELGPVAGKNFIHGHTASFALFRPKT
jgi:small ligand-binding sensory domain FIST